MGPVPSQEICKDFFKKVGGKKDFQQKNLGGAIVNKDGEQHECPLEDGPGEFGWCQVTALPGCFVAVFVLFSDTKFKEP